MIYNMHGLNSGAAGSAPFVRNTQFSERGIFIMINSLLVGATFRSFEDIFKTEEIPYQIEESEAYKTYIETWEGADESDRALALRQARPAIRRIATKEPFIFKKDGEPLWVRFNDANRRMEDSFGEILIERADLNWRFAISVKSDARIIATMPVADRSMDRYVNSVASVFNEIDDFGDRIFGVPCSNDYFDDMNDILQMIEPYDSDTWRKMLVDDSFVNEHLFAPMLKAIGFEIERICKDHPEAPQRLIDYFYRKIDYYYINPIDEVGVTRIGAVNSHRCLGNIPNNDNLYTPHVPFPTKLYEVRFANGRFGELSDDTIQLNFDGGWSVCITIRTKYTEEYGRYFALSVYLPVTPFGSYRDQVKWDKEA